MQRSVSLWIGIPLILAACTTPSQTTSDGFIAVLPEGVLAIAAPYQDLTAVRIDPTDGCYVYRYVGPVETTFLPLRSRRGGPICTRPADPRKAG
jgi:hypothetical protein